MVAESRTSMSGCRAVKLWGWRRTLKAAAAFDIFARGAGAISVGYVRSPANSYFE